VADAGDLPEGAYLVTGVATKTGTSGQGPWTNYTVTFNDGVKASTFSDSIGKLALACKTNRTPVERLTEAKGQFKNLTELRAWVGDQSAEEPCYTGGPDDDRVPF
jgi:hypothetical protein